MYNFILKTTALCLTVCYSFNAYSQNNSVNNTVSNNVNKDGAQFRPIVYVNILDD
jgi:hypothetical protein